MKKLSFFLSIAVAAILLQAHSCHKDRDYPSTCGDIACTMIFSMVTVDVHYNNGQPVILDEYYTIDDQTGDKIVSQQNIPDSGTYVVVDDNYISALTNKTRNFHFIGKKAGVELVNESYTIKGDCCHVSKESGKSAISLP